MRADASGQGRWAFGLTVAAFLWAIALLGAAILVPVYSGEGELISGSGGSAASVEHHTSATLVGENGLAVLIALAVPVLLTVLVWVALHVKCSRGGSSGDRVAWTAIAALMVFSLIAALSVGPFIVPVAVLLAGATSLTPLGRTSNG